MPVLSLFFDCWNGSRSQTFIDHYCRCKNKTLPWAKQVTLLVFSAGLFLSPHSLIKLIKLQDCMQKQKTKKKQVKYRLESIDFAKKPRDHKLDHKDDLLELDLQ